MLVAVTALSSDKKELLQKEFGMSGRCCLCAFCDAQRRYEQGLEEIVEGNSSDMVFFDNGLQRLGIDRRGLVGIEVVLHQFAEERVQGAVFRCKAHHMRPTTNEEVCNLGAEGDMLFEELLMRAKEFAQGDDFGGWQAQALKKVSVVLKSIGQDESVPSVVFGAADTMSVTESVELFGIDGEDGDAAFEQGLDDCSMWLFDSYSDAMGVTCGHLEEPVDGL